MNKGGGSAGPRGSDGSGGGVVAATLTSHLRTSARPLARPWCTTHLFKSDIHCGGCYFVVQYLGACRRAHGDKTGCRGHVQCTRVSKKKGNCCNVYWGVFAHTSGTRGEWFAHHEALRTLQSRHSLAKRSLVSRRTALVRSPKAQKASKTARRSASPMSVEGVGWYHTDPVW